MQRALFFFIALYMNNTVCAIGIQINTIELESIFGPTQCGQHAYPKVTLNVLIV
jgi:hypothetical protein